MTIGEMLLMAACIFGTIFSMTILMARNGWIDFPLPKWLRK